MLVFCRRLFLFWTVFTAAALYLSTATAAPRIGVVILHGKGGAPTRLVAELATDLEARGMRVANLDMPWSGRRHYDVSVSAAEQEVAQALADLRRQGAQKLFVAGHSQGGLFALHYAGKHDLDGLICIAPGGSVGNDLFREKLGSSVARAMKLVAAGQGEVKSEFDDYEGKRGTFPVLTTPAIYLTWFDPEGAMNIERAARALNPRVPALWIVPQHDYPGLRRANLPLFGSVSKNPKSALYEPDSDHLGAPSASREEIARWINAIAGSGGK